MRAIALAVVATAFATSAHAGFFQSTATDPVTGDVYVLSTTKTPDYVPAARPAPRSVLNVEVRRKDNGRRVTITRYSDGTSTKSTKGRGKH